MWWELRRMIWWHCWEALTLCLLVLRRQVGFGMPSGIGGQAPGAAYRVRPSLLEDFGVGNSVILLKQDAKNVSVSMGPEKSTTART